MNAMIRVLKGALAVLALAGLGWLLRWMTAGSITGLRTYDLDSLTVLAVGTIAWIAYGWLTLAVVLTILEQMPGVVGSLAGAIAGRITTKTARALLRSGLGVAAVTPLTIGAAHASPADSAHVRQVTQANPQSAAFGTDFRATEPASTIHLGAPQQADFGATEAASTLEVGGAKPEQDTSHLGNYRATERASNLEVGGTETASRQDTSNYRATEAGSTLEVGGTEAAPRQDAADRRSTEAGSTLDVGGSTPQQGTSRQGTSRVGDFRATEPASSLELGGATHETQRTGADKADGDRTGNTAGQQQTDDFRATEPGSKLHLTNPTPSGKPTPERPTTTPNPPAPTAEPTTPSEPTRTTKPTTPGRPTTTAGPTTPSEHTPTATPTNPTQHTRTAKPTTPGRPTSTDKPTTTPAQRPTTSTRDTGSDKPTAPAQPTTSDSGRTPEGKAGSSEQHTTGGRVGVPDRPTDGAPTRYTSLRPNVPVSVVVRAGDSLWSIAARELGPSATNEAIAARWHDWYAANRHVIGNDPDLILPGQVLRTPPMSNGDHLPPHDQEQ
jgi:hypothetical protein